MRIESRLQQYSLLLCSFLFVACFAQEEKVIQLWQDSIPNAIENPDYEEVQTFKDSMLWSTEKVKEPTLTIFSPEQPNGTAVVICPGGGYHHLAINKEGYKIAEWLNTRGITAFVLKYRMPNDSISTNKTIAPLQDAQRAMRYVRQNAKHWNLNENKIGVLGFSAGGHLASTLSTHYNDAVYKAEYEVSARPDFSILVYPVISMKDGVTHQGSKTNLLGETPSNETVEFYSNETQITSETPKTILIHATDDKSVPVENSLQYYLALKENKVPAELHIYEKGGHGFGLGRGFTSDDWPKACETWLKKNDL